MPDTLKYNRLQGTRILILGGTSGIGYCVAEAALESGAKGIVLSSSSPDKVTKAVERLKKSYPELTSRASVTGTPCDLSDVQTVETNIENLLKFATDNGTDLLTHIVNTAGGIANVKPLQESNAASLHDSTVVRFVAPTLLAKYASMYLVPGPESSITYTSGTAADKPFPGRGVLSANAATVKGLTIGMALDLAPVRVNLVLPGAVDTELWDMMPKEAKQGLMKALSKECLTGAVATPEQVAEAYLYAMKDANCTGAFLGTNGGALYSRPEGAF